MATALNVHQTAVSQWETNRTSPDVQTMGAIAEYFNVSIDYLLGRTDDPTPPSLNEQMSEIEFALSGELRDMSDAEKQDILDYVRFKRRQRQE